MPLTDEQKAARAAKRRMTQALKEEARAHREEARRREWVEKGMYLTREAAAAGEPCRACGLPVIDHLGNWPGTMYLSPEERIEYDAAEARFKEMHPDCESHRWSMSGSRATHCGFCCPPIPFEGWVTDSEYGLTHAQQLTALGNGVAPPQAVAAVRALAQVR